MAEWFSKLAALDRSGRIDFGAAVEVIARMYDPTLAERIAKRIDLTRVVK